MSRSSKKFGTFTTFPTNIKSVDNYIVANFNNLVDYSIEAYKKAHENAVFRKIPSSDQYPSDWSTMSEKGRFNFLIGNKFSTRTSLRMRVVRHSNGMIECLD